MPEIKHYEGKKKAHSKGHHSKAHNEAKHGHKRRPHHEIEEEIIEAEEIQVEAAHTMGEADEAMDEAQAINTEAQNEGVYAPDEVIVAEAEMISEGGPAYGEEPTEEITKKIHLEFYGSELIRQKAPKVMELADTVAEEWVHDGQFEGLPVGHPLAQVAAAKALRKAKDVEKKLEEKGVIAMAKMGFDFLKSKIEKK